MKVTIAYIEEPPFGWTQSDHTATGADLDLGGAVLHAMGVAQIAHQLTTFSELLPQLRMYLGSTAHRARVAAFGLTAGEIDPVFMR